MQTSITYKDGHENVFTHVRKLIFDLSKSRLTLLRSDTRIERLDLCDRDLAEVTRIEVSAVLGDLVYPGDELA